MKAKELVEMTTAEIEQKLASLKEELFNLRFQSVTGQLDNTARIPPGSQRYRPLQNGDA